MSNAERPIIVTGGASGIGAAIVERLEADGYPVRVFDLNADDPIDITDHDAVVAAGFGRPFAEGPTAPQAPVAPPGAAEITVDQATGLVTLPPGARLDLGGIAKGHAADLLVAELLEGGATGAAATIGGDTAAGGRCPFAPAWPITATECSPEPIAHLDRGGFCFSTTRRRRWATPAGTAHHVIDPTTGEPASTAWLRSVRRSVRLTT